MRVLILGSTGFLGRLLGDELARAGHDVERWSRGAAELPEQASRRVDLAHDVELPAPRARPDAAVLLAGASVPRAFDERAAADTRLVAERALAHLARHAPGARVVVASSAHVLAPSPVPIDERAPLAPVGVYGAAKAAVEERALAASRELDVVVARLFGSLGPGQPRGLFVPDLLEQLAHADARGDERVVLGGPDAARDLTDGRDVARALRALVEAPHASERVVHVGSGVATLLSDLAARIARAVGSRARIEFAPGAGPTWIADPARLRARTGWRPIETPSSTVDWIARGSALARRADA